MPSRERRFEVRFEGTFEKENKMSRVSFRLEERNKGKGG